MCTVSCTEAPFSADEMSRFGGLRDGTVILVNPVLVDSREGMTLMSIQGRASFTRLTRVKGGSFPSGTRCHVVCPQLARSGGSGCQSETMELQGRPCRATQSHLNAGRSWHAPACLLTPPPLPPSFHFQAQPRPRRLAHAAAPITGLFKGCPAGCHWPARAKPCAFPFLTST